MIFQKMERGGKMIRKEPILPILLLFAEGGRVSFFSDKTPGADDFLLFDEKVYTAVLEKAVENHGE